MAKDQSPSPDTIRKKLKKLKKKEAEISKEGSDTETTFSKKKKKKERYYRKKDDSDDPDTKKEKKSKKKKRDSSSPEERRKKRSPKRLSRSPKRRSRSPKRRSPRRSPPRRRSPSARRRSPSPRRRSRSPVRRSSPYKRKRSRTPRRSRSPRKRSKERRRERRRSKERRSRSKDRRSKSREKKSKSPEKKRAKTKSPKRKSRSGSSASSGSESPTRSKLVAERKVEVEKFQSEMEKEMEKRKERIEAWRAERKKKSDPSSGEPSTEQPKKIWSLEDDDEDDDTQPAGEDNDKKDEDDDESEVDPLEAFMEGVSNEIKAENKQTNVVKKVKKIVKGKEIEVAVATKVEKEAKQKGDLMANDAEAMEYSSEDISDDDLDDMNYAGYKNKRRRELEATDHSQMNYEEFRKNFYVEVPELARITDAELADIHLSLDNMQVRGKNPPKPIKTWIQAGISMKILGILKKHGMTEPTPIQSIALPSIMSGRDVIGIAKTGSGKTLSFLLPMFRHIMDQRPLEAEEGPIAVLMSPTRELALQTYNECRKFTKALRLRVVCVYGGTGISEQIAELKRGCEIIVCTPGRMIDMLTANSGKVTNCRRVTYCVFDEADRMFDMGFEPQVNKIMSCIRPDRQVVMFSATFPRQMEALARKILVKPIEITTGGRSKVCSDVDQNIIIIDEEDKFNKLMEILGHFGEGQSLIFVHTQQKCDTILKDLMHASYSVMSLHGGMDQHDRDSVIQDFKHGNVRVLVATSVAARGLDVKALRLVVNLDAPNHYEDYVHRVGRTGRAGMKGTAYTFLQPDQARYAGDLITALEVSEVRVPSDLDKLWKDYVAEQQEAGLKVEKNKGFSGKGYKFNEEEAMMHDERKQLQKFQLGLQDSDEEDLMSQKQDELENAIEAIMGGKKAKLAISDKAANPTPAVKIDIRKGKTIEEKVGHLQGAERAAAICTLLGKEKKPDPAELKQAAPGIQGPSLIDPTAHATSAFMKGERVTAVSGKGLAAQIAASINAKKNFTKANEEDLLVNPTVAPPAKVEEEIEINDLPQQARYRITSKDAIASIQEYSECALTVRGTYYPPNKNPPEGMRKLFICIEGAKERAIQLAKMELKRMIKEELNKAQMFSFGSGARTAGGRYSVL
ncbi:hypothetical protein ACHWQZ_G007485 [Mnemiopsis leidyi]